MSGSATEPCLSPLVLGISASVDSFSRAMPEPDDDTHEHPFVGNCPNPCRASFPQRRPFAEPKKGFGHDNVKVDLISMSLHSWVAFVS